jgi:DNA end-binding protein Ku
MAGDPVQDRLLDLIAAKKKGRKRTAKPKAPPKGEAPSNVINIMDTLKKSIAAEGKGGPKRR